MYNNTTLGDLIKFLETLPPEAEVRDGFGYPHSDRGSYDKLAFTPMETAKAGEMLAHALSAVDVTFTGWEGGPFTMDVTTPVYIGEFGECGEPITPTHFKYWELTSAQ